MKIEIQETDNTDEVKNAVSDAILAALEAIGLTAEGYAKLLCPVDTGRLRNSISHAVDEDEKTVYIGTNVEYAPYVEMGTSKTKAQPYLKPAATNHNDEYRAIIERYLKDGV